RPDRLPGDTGPERRKARHRLRVHARHAQVRNAKLPLPAGASDTAFRTLAATDDGTVLLRRSGTDAGTPHADLVAMTRDGAVAYVVPLTALDGVAVAGNLVLATGVDAATPASSSSLLTFSGGNLV